MTYQRLRLLPPCTTPRGQALEIIDFVAAKHGLTRADLLGRNRTDFYRRARHEAMWEIKRLWPSMTHEKIGHLFGGRERTTVFNGIHSHAKIISEASDPDTPDLFARAA